jgi:hypothetical protein
MFYSYAVASRSSAYTIKRIRFVVYK